MKSKNPNFIFHARMGRSFVFLGRRWRKTVAMHRRSRALVSQHFCSTGLDLPRELPFKRHALLLVEAGAARYDVGNLPQEAVLAELVRNCS